MNVNRNVLRAAAAGASVLLAGLAGAAFAHPEGKADNDEKVTKMVIITERVGHDGKEEAKGAPVRTFIIKRDGEGKAGEGAEVHTFHIVRDGKGGPGVQALALADGAALKCDDGDKLVDESAGDDKEKTKVVICSKGATPAQAAERLEQAIAKINSNSEISAEHKARIIAALRAAIDRASTSR